MTREYTVLCRLESQENLLVFTLRGRKSENKRSTIEHQSETGRHGRPRRVNSLCSYPHTKEFRVWCPQDMAIVCVPIVLYVGWVWEHSNRVEHQRVHKHLLPFVPARLPAYWVIPPLSGWILLLQFVKMHTNNL